MKRIVKFFCLGICVLVLTGCMDYQINMNIKDDKSVDVNMSMEIDMYDFAQKLLVDAGMWSLVQEDMINDACTASCPFEENTEEYTTCMNTCTEEATSSISDEPTEEDIKNFLDSGMSEEASNEEMLNDEEIKELEEMGYVVDAKFDEENYIYNVTISQHFDNIDDISTTNELKINLEELFNPENNNIQNVFFTRTVDNTYKANYVIENDMDNTSELPEDLDLSELITYNYVVTLPNKAVSNNATTVSNDGKTLTWDLVGGNTSAINFEFSFEKPGLLDSLSDDTLRIIAICLIAGGVIGLIITISVMISKGRK